MLGILSDGVRGRTKPFNFRRLPTVYIKGMVNVPLKTETNLKERKEMPKSCRAKDWR